MSGIIATNYNIYPPYFSSSTKGWSLEVNTYADLPAAADYTNDVVLVKNDSGIWPFKKKAGFWRSTGSAWQWLGVLTLGSMADVNISGIADGQGIKYDSANGGFIPYMPLQFVGFAKISAGTAQPGSPGTNDLWIDIN